VVNDVATCLSTYYRRRYRTTSRFLAVAALFSSAWRTVHVTYVS